MGGNMIVKYEVVVYDGESERRYSRTAPVWKYRQDRKMYEELENEGAVWGYQILYRGAVAEGRA